jgi:hypothetical protein
MKNGGRTLLMLFAIKVNSNAPVEFGRVVAVNTRFVQFDLYLIEQIYIWPWGAVAAG